jgi:Family of unknown function (DUF6223)
MPSVHISLVAGLAAAGITSGRAQSLVALAVALISMVVGGLALARSARGADAIRRGRPIVALVVGLIGMALSGLHLASTTGGIGTGSGRLGAIVALAVALAGTLLGGLALARSRRTS